MLRTLLTRNKILFFNFRLLEQNCGHLPYPCRFQDPAATSQVVIPHRVFAPQCLKKSCEEVLLQLIPQCLSAAYDLLGTHPFSRLDVLIVPPNFSSLGMARYWYFSIFPCMFTHLLILLGIYLALLSLPGKRALFKILSIVVIPAVLQEMQDQ